DDRGQSSERELDRSGEVRPSVARCARRRSENRRGPRRDRRETPGSEIPMSVEPAGAPKRPAGERIGRLPEDGPALIDRGRVRRRASPRVRSLTIAALQQVGGRLPHLHEPEDQSHYDDDGPELTGPR